MLLNITQSDVKFYWRLITGCLLQYLSMNIPDCTILEFDPKNERIDYQARYSGQDLTFSHIKSWTIKAENYDDETKSAMLRRWLD